MARKISLRWRLRRPSPNARAAHAGARCSSRPRPALIDDVVLDVGCGEGMIGFGALERGAANVVFSDISVDLLDRCRQFAEDQGLSDRCSFINAAADDLEGVADASVDVVATRSVLIYVGDKS